MENWEEKSNQEIMAAHIQMDEEYEAKKLEIVALGTKMNKLIAELDELDRIYLESKKVLDARLSYLKNE